MYFTELKNLHNDSFYIQNLINFISLIPSQINPHDQALLSQKKEEKKINKIKKQT